MSNKTETSLCRIAKEMCLGLVANKEALDVGCARLKKSGINIIEVVCDPKDFGRLIGKQGGNFKAIKFILERVASVMGESVELSIPDPGSSERSVVLPFRRNKNWLPSDILPTVHLICKSTLVHPYVDDVCEGKARTRIEVTINEDEQIRHQDFCSLSDAIRKIVHAHAKNQGWEVEFNMVRQ